MLLSSECTVSEQLDSGQKDSGFGRFAGPEGLRGLCHVKSVVENRFSFIAAEIPAQLAYPANGQGPAFCTALINILYGYGVMDRCIATLLCCMGLT